MKNFSAREFELAPYRELSDGTIARVYPYHLCFEGKEDAVLFRDDEDCDVMVKYIALSAYKCATILVHYVVVSNHVHIILLAAEDTNARHVAEEIKKTYSMWMRRKYSEIKALNRLEIKVLALDSLWYLRNAIAYVTRNALDNSRSIDAYPWSAHRAFFASNKYPIGTRMLSDLSLRKQRDVLHSRNFPKCIRWQIDENNSFVPLSICSVRYVEAAFYGDIVFYMKTIGLVNLSEMKVKLVELSSNMQYDSEVYKIVSEISQRWFGVSLNQLSILQKARMISYVRRKIKTTASQLARVFGIEKDKVHEILGTK